MAPRSQPYRIEYPLNAEQAQNIDECFQILFDDIRNGSVILDLSQATGTLAVTHGGTGLTSWVVGDIVYATATTTLAGLAIGSAGKVIRSTGTLPAYSTFTIPDTFAQGDIIYGSTSNVLTALTKDTNATRYLSNTGASNSPAWAQVNLANGVTGILGLALGGTNADLSATGGTSRVLKQTSVGATISVAQLAASDLSNGTTGTGAVVLADSPALTTSPTAPTQVTTDNSTKLATTAYVTTAVANAVAAVNPAVAVQAATTSAANTSSYTYLNGVGGIGATLTGVANTALTVDGYTFTALGQRILVKNDTQAPSGAFNGVYYVTQVQTLTLPLVLTRTLDYDQPSDINNTGAIPVINGTVNGTTTWVETATVNTIGTDALTFTEFSFNPANVVTSITGTVNQITASSATGAVTLSLAGGFIAAYQSLNI